jgi:hypothetical protein
MDVSLYYVMNLTASANTIYHYLKQKIGKNEFFLSKKYSISNTQRLEDLFSFPFQQIPNNYFLSVGIDGSGEGQLKSYHLMQLNPPELGIFETIEVKIVGEENKQVLLRSNQTNTINLSLVKTLVNDLHRLYGKDDTGYSLFTSRDEDCLEKGTYWSGRLWQNSQGTHQVPLNLYADEDGLALAFMLTSKV